MKIHIVTYWAFKDKKTFVGGLRPYRLHHYLKKSNIQSEIIAPQLYEGHETIVSEGWLTKILKPLLRAFPPDASIFWSIKVFLLLLKRPNKKGQILFTTIPPNGVGVAGLLLKQFKKNWFWIIDFRDLWTKHPLYLPPITKRFFDPIIEKLYFKCADLVVLNTEWDLNYNTNLHPVIKNKAIYVRNGFDKILENKSKKESEITFIYTGGTTGGQATEFINEILISLNENGIPSKCYFFGEYDSGMENRKYIKYMGVKAPHKIPELLTNYRYGFIYLPQGSEKGGRVAQKFYDYIGSGVVPVCIRPSIEMKNLMEKLGTGIQIPENYDLENLIIDLKKSSNHVDTNIAIKLSRESQFEKLKNYLDT